MKELIIRWAALIGIGVSSFFVGINYARQTMKPDVQIVTKVVTEVKEVEKVVTKQVVKRVVVKDTHVDGSITEITKEDEITDSEQNKDTDTSVKVANKTTTINRANNWGIGMHWDILHPNYVPIGADVNRRILGDAWVNVGVQWMEHKQLTLGILYEF